MYPSGKPGANAAWLRLQVVTHNVLQLVKAVALPPAYQDAYPKRPRHVGVFTHLGQVVWHAGRLLLSKTLDLSGRVLVADWGSG